VPPPRKKHTALRLAVMMFLQYGGLGAWCVPLSRWLGTPADRGGLGFAPQQITDIYSTLALGYVIAPLVTGFLADRTFSSERLIGVLNGLKAIIMVAAGVWCDRHSGTNADPAKTFLLLFILLIVYSVFVMIGITAGTAKTLRNLLNPAGHFGKVRLVGTLGWVVAVFLAAFVCDPLSPQPFYVAAACHALLALFMPWLPHTPPLGKGKPIAEVIGLPAVKLFKDPSFVLFVFVAFVAAAAQQYYTVFGNVCLGALHVHHPEIWFSTSQGVEMACMFSLPLVVGRFGLKSVMCVGLIAWAVRNYVFMSEEVPWILAVGIPLQGVAYTYFSIVGSLYIDREAPLHLRAGAQSLLVFFASGPGTLLGNQIAGISVERARDAAGVVQWSQVWLLPAVTCTIITILFLALFHEPRSKPTT
jgi:nucleoside transporter